MTADPVGAARSVVGWYGDPTVSWSVLLRATLERPVDPDVVARRLAATVERFPHLGKPPAVHQATDAELADRPYGDGEPLVRVAVDDHRLAIAAHHGAADGLGLLALLGAALGTEVTSGARGIGDRSSARSFATTAVRRLAEALVRPPARIRPRGGDQAATGDALAAADCRSRSFGTGALVAATARAVERWNGDRGRIVAGVGLSRRGGRRLSPDVDSAFVRLPLPRHPGDEAVRRLLAATPPEPAYPHTRSLAPQAVTRALASRLGSTFLASNLGVVRADGVRALAFHPTASGRSGVAVGAVTVGPVSTVTVRARRRDFDGEAAESLLDGVVDELELRR